jgi:hypothetical protein
MLEDNFLDREIENWRGFRHVLYNDDQEKFVKMMSEARAYAKEAKNAPTKEPAEALFMTLIFHQQKIITRLLDAIAKLEYKIDPPY